MGSLGRGMKEQPDKVVIRGEVEWRCHGCGTRVATRQMLQERGVRLLCWICTEEADGK